MTKRKVIKSLLLLIWMFIIFLFSHQPHSGQATHSLIEQFLPMITNTTIINIINFIIRKSAHLTEYFILAILTISLLKDYHLTNKKIMIITLVFCFIYALTDEYHQTFIAGRTGQFKDSLIDTIGAITAIVTYNLITYYNTKKNKK